MSLYNLTLVAAGLVALGVYLTSSVARRRMRDVDGLPRPPRESWLFGNLPQLFLPQNYGDHEFGWQAEYGDVYVIHGVLGQSRMMVSDPAALNHLLRNDDVHLAPMMLALGRSLFGRDNAMALRDASHRKLRAALNLGFAPAVVKGYLETFESVARGITTALDLGDGQEGSVVDISEPLSTATLSAISQGPRAHSGSFRRSAGRRADTGEHFNPVECLSSPRTLIASIRSPSAEADRFGRAQFVAEAMAPYLPAPFLDWMFGLPLPMFAAIRRAYELARKIEDQAIQDLAQSEDSNERSFEHLYAKILAQNSKRALSPDELAMQTNLVLIAGQDTTANTLAFALTELARQPALQDALRGEIRKARLEPATDYDSLPLLNAVIKEALRLLPAEPIGDKIAHVDLTLPLSRPVTLSDGRVVDQLFVPKGQLVGLAFAGYQRGGTRWGPEPEAFNPYRWIEGKVGVSEPMATSPYAHLLAFSNGGDLRERYCLRLTTVLNPALHCRSILEMQVILAELVPKFVFKIPDDPALAMRFRFANTLMPCNDKGEKRAWLAVERVQDL
ncbi:unnamed protein product [Mycena citricolor]|uniref:Cytochrome P450 n=1 Tax=Mycena citricolor TaxID=2018698 RepID=A0AAD2K0A4_9AGAR|nr:unnamed protein product [Mycena citricolor]